MSLPYFLLSAVFVVDQIKREQKALLRAAKQLNDMDDRLIHKSSGVVQGLTEKRVEGGGDYGTSSVGSWFYGGRSLNQFVWLVTGSN